jgi:hypothetical protein
MFFLLRSLIIALVGLLLAASLLLSQLIDNSPKKPLDWQPNQQLAREIFIKVSEQSKTKQDLTLNKAELNHILNSLLNRYLKSTTLVTLQDNDVAIVETSLQLPKKLYGFFLNIRFELHNDQKGLALRQLRIGNLPIHPAITNRIVNHLLQHSFLRHYHRLGVQHIQTIQIKNHLLVASYEINTKAPGLVNANNIDPALLYFYQQQLDLVTSKHDPKWRLSLAELFSPLFKIAYKRTALKEAITENIAIIYAVSAYVNANEMPFYLAINQPLTNKHLYPVFLYKRTDQAKHFMLSAALTTSGGVQLADVMGQEKELRDAQTKSGFSFIDLAADRAGMRFSEQATRSPETAKKLQRMMADIKDYRTFMPDVQDLPEKLTQSQFNQRFDGVGSKPYKALLQQIDERIMALPIYLDH